MAKAACSTNPFHFRARPTDITVSYDRKWLAVIYSVGTEAFVTVFSIAIPIRSGE
jgi:hypothetical protein